MVLSLLGSDSFKQGEREPLLQSASSSSQSASIWSTLTFSWVNPLMNAGSGKQLCQDDLFPLPGDLDPEVCRDRLWEACLESENKSLFWAIFRSYGWSFFFIGLLKVVNDCLSFSGPLFLNAIMKYLQSGKHTSHGRGYWYACGIGGISLLRGFMGTHYSFLVARLRLKLKAGLTTIVYRKALSIRVAQRNSFSTGEIQTLMSVDADRTINLFSSVHDLWSLPLQIVVALCMLYMQVKYSFLAGLAVVILLIPVNRWIAVKIGEANTFMMAQKDERIRRTSELLTHIWTVKMYAWETFFAHKIRTVRNEEMKHLSTRKYLDALCVYFWACTPTLFSVLTFGLFTFLGHTLDAATVFTSLALFNILISPLNSFPWVITGIVEAWVSIQRLQRFLSSPDSSQTFSRTTPEMDRNTALKVSEMDFSWSSSLPTLKRISLDIPKGSLVVVLGQVGSGKSSLLHAILNEMNCERDSVYVSGSTAFVSQTPWIRSGSLRENILFGRLYVEDRYDQVVRACSLDFDVELMHKKDLSEIGERGCNLSGGQKARLALARAIYQDCDIYLLDDPLSAVDPHVAAWLMHHAIQGPLLRDKTRVLCTHHHQAASLADIVVLVENGHAKCITSTPCKHLNSDNNQSEIEVDTEVTPYEDRTLCGNDREAKSFSLVEEEARDHGRVKATVYRTYAVFTGCSILAITVASTSLMQATKNGNDWWLAHWVDKTSSNDHHHSVKFYLKILFVIGGLNSLFTLLRAFSFACGGLRAAFQVHETLLNNILRASILFFEKNPVGRILNRFSSDLYTIDDSLPFIANILLAHCFSLLGILIVLCLVQWEIVVLLIPLGFIYFRIQRFYRETSRELRRLDSVSRSPIYASFSEALDGASTIRAFQRQDMFLAQNVTFVEANQRASFSEIAASLWLSIRLQIMAAFLVFFVSMMAVLSRDKDLLINSTTAGLIGLALSYAAPVISLLNNLLTAFSETEKEMVSVERVQQYLMIDIEVPEKGDNQELEDVHLPENWPENGEVEFENVKLVYRPELPPALSNISFKIAAGEKVGIAGRTGAGKSSILCALFRLRPISFGRIIIDGFDISKLILHQLRESLSVVPQSPFLFEGTVRENLDPTGQASDCVLWEMIAKCHLKPAVESAGLDTQVRECGESFSVGQRQLLCLARSLLKRSRILCLDECTANVDPETTRLLKRTIAHECQDVTVVTIAHRLSTISDLQRVLVLDRGRLVEQGDPQALLRDKGSKFNSLAEAVK
ncbi:ABC transporter C family member 13 isoform X1 [Selaginella moellendorffii]|uniref:ABC transporter C family member 13 isoform X1 n=1 Tax=Selaginella moellendorffii TaxID=88036 RepID=UPI000D1CDE2B|nr:ABC transporter C family member 13 isoform X1 [Selaginella moellendorffii]|eukprot:XP_024537956.1 ABC transporter C family member 13 isoform X1 [Selaginella moellendorffii]